MGFFATRPFNSPLLFSQPSAIFVRGADKLPPGDEDRPRHYIFLLGSPGEPRAARRRQEERRKHDG